MYYYYYYYSFFILFSFSVMLRNATNILRMVRILATSVDGTVRSVTQQEVRSRVKDFHHHHSYSLFLHLAVCFWKVQEEHTYINTAPPLSITITLIVGANLTSVRSYIIMHANLESDGDDCVCVALASEMEAVLALVNPHVRNR